MVLEISTYFYLMNLSFMYDLLFYLLNFVLLLTDIINLFQIFDYFVRFQYRLIWLGFFDHLMFDFDLFVFR